MPSSQFCSSENNFKNILESFNKDNIIKEIRKFFTNLEDSGELTSLFKTIISKKENNANSNNNNKNNATITTNISPATTNNNIEEDLSMMVEMYKKALQKYVMSPLQSSEQIAAKLNPVRNLVKNTSISRMKSMRSLSKV